MYRIIGADGREYGPITADQLRQWITEHRANAQSKVLVEGTTEWKSLAELTEFTALVGGPPGAPKPPPFVGAAEGESIAGEILARDYQLEIGRCISRGWDLVMANFGLTVGTTLLLFLISFAVALVPFGGLLLKYVFWGGVDWLFLKLVRGQKAELSDAFCGFTLAFVPLMLFSLVGQLLTGVGFILCIIPGIYLLVAWLLFSPLLILDKRLDFWPAMELSRKVVTRHWWQVFGLCLLFLLIGLAGSLLCGIGIFIAMPINTAAKVFAYEAIFGPKTTPAQLTDTPSPPGVAPITTPAPTPVSTPAPPPAV